MISSIEKILKINDPYQGIKEFRERDYIIVKTNEQKPIGGIIGTITSSRITILVRKADGKFNIYNVPLKHIEGYV